MKPITQKVTFKNHDAVNTARADILKILDDICTKNNLRYFAFRDLLVGAVHYNDFIPNGLKSKTEIGLMRDEYDKLCEILYKKADELDLQLIDRYPSGAKALNLTVSRNVDIESDDAIISDLASVEISAFDFLPDSEAEQKMYLRKVANLRDKYNKMVNLTPPGTTVPMSLRKVFGLFWGTLVYGTKNPKKTYHKLHSTVKKYQNTKYITRLIPRRSVMIEYDNVFPTKRIKVNHAEINIPNTYNKWTVEINDELMEQTRTIQKIDLVLLKEFDRVCRKIGVGYFVCGGTMLGYMRHNGFIPWDDDIDVGMLRADYDKFIKEGGKYLGEDFFLQTRQSDPKIPYLFSKIRLNGTSYITNYNEKRDFHKGICLDLFPFDYIPNSLNERQRFKNKVKFWANIHHKVINRHKEKVVYDAKPKTFYEWWARTYNEIRRRIVHLVPLKLTQRLYIKKATTYNSKAKEMGLTTVASFLPTYTYADVNDMIPYQDINFEGVKVMALKDMDKFLTMQYKDYMRLPLLHQRVGHDLVSWHVDEEIAKKYNIYND
ncbi:MAG: LicD family protein [Ruminococcus sp.]|nr:LicD family protein [Ruminococcus sp.]